MKHEWKDATSYARSDTKREPRTWQYGIRSMRLCVTRKFLHPGAWYLFCPELGADEQLRATKLEEAKAEALEKCRARVAKWAKELGA